MADTGAVVERIMTMVAAEAKRIVAEGVATAEDIDTAMRFGALFKKPPFEYIEEVGPAEFKKRLAEYQEKFGDRFKV